MPVRCPACHSTQTKPAPARNFLERLSGLLGRRAYFCEDCYRRFTPSKSSAPDPEEAPPLATAEDEEAPQSAMVVEAPVALAEPDAALENPSAPPPGPPPAPAQPFPDEDDSLISRMRRQQMEEENARHQEADSDRPSRLTLPLSPAKLAGALVGALLLIVLILWYRSSLEQAPVPAHAPTTRVKISEGAPPASPEGAPSLPAPSTGTPAPAAGPSEPAPTSVESPPPSPAPAAPAPLPMPAAPLVQAPAEAPAPTVLPAPPAQPAPSRRSAKPAPARKAPPAKSKPLAARPTAAHSAKATGNYAVQFGAFSQAPRAQALAAKLKAKGIQVQVVKVKGRDGKVWHKVRSGGLASQEEAQRVLRKLEQTSGSKGMVVRLRP